MANYSIGSQSRNVTIDLTDIKRIIEYGKQIESYRFKNVILWLKLPRSKKSILEIQNLDYSSPFFPCLLGIYGRFCRKSNKKSLKSSNLTLFSCKLQHPLCCVVQSLTVMCQGEVLFSSCLVGVLRASCTWMSVFFSKLGQFATAVSLNRFSKLLLFPRPSVEYQCIWQHRRDPQLCVPFSCFLLLRYFKRSVFKAWFFLLLIKSAIKAFQCFYLFFNLTYCILHF